MRAISLPTTVTRREEPTVWIPSQPVSWIRLPMIAADTPPDQMPPSWVPVAAAGSSMLLISLSSATAWRAAEGSS